MIMYFACIEKFSTWARRGFAKNLWLKVNDTEKTYLLYETPYLDTSGLDTLEVKSKSSIYKYRDMLIKSCYKKEIEK